MTNPAPRYWAVFSPDDIAYWICPYAACGKREALNHFQNATYKPWSSFESRGFTIARATVTKGELLCDIQQ